MIKALTERHPALEACGTDIESAIAMIVESYESGGKLLLCGNGGSAADCDHIVGELMKGFLSKRQICDEKKADMLRMCPGLDEIVLDSLQMGLPAISLHSALAFNTAFCNDVAADLVYAQALFALGKKNDVLLAISTSGNSENVVRAAEIAKAMGIRVIGLTGVGGGKLKSISDVTICVPESETYKVQELHLPVYHYICSELEKHFFGH